MGLPKARELKTSPSLPHPYDFYNTWAHLPGNRLYQGDGRLLERQLCSSHTLERKTMFYKMWHQEIILANPILSPSQEF